MTQEELIDAIYENEAIEGLAIFNSNQTLAENQLALSEEAVAKIGATLFTIAQGLNSAGRVLNGLLIKSSSLSILVFVEGKKLLLLQLDPDKSVDTVFLSLKSQLGTKLKPIILEEETQSTAKAQTRSAQPAAAQSATPVEEPAIEGGVEWERLEKSLVSAFKKVSPAQLAKKLIATSAEENGVGATTKQGTPEQATAIATNACSQIPNAARRKMLAKELELILKKFIA